MRRALLLGPDRREALARGLGQAVQPRSRRFRVQAEGARWVVVDSHQPAQVPAVAVGLEGEPLTTLEAATELASLLEGLALLRRGELCCDRCEGYSLTVTQGADGRRLCSACRERLPLVRLLTLLPAEGRA